MAVETADDRLLMLSDFGVAARYLSARGGSANLKVIFDNAYEAVDTGGGVTFAVRQPRVTCRTSDIAGAREGDTLTVDGTAYIIRIVMPDGTGITEMMLEAP